MTAFGPKFIYMLDQKRQSMRKRQFHYLGKALRTLIEEVMLHKQSRHLYDSKTGVDLCSAYYNHELDRAMIKVHARRRFRLLLNERR
jgi:hypothetical protein